MKNLITSIIAVTIIAAMAVSLFFVCYLVYDALPIWFQYSLGLGCFYALVSTATINLWGKSKGLRKKDKLQKSYKIESQYGKLDFSRKSHKKYQLQKPMKKVFTTITDTGTNILNLR